MKKLFLACMVALVLGAVGLAACRGSLLVNDSNPPAPAPIVAPEDDCPDGT
jgi:hypothetical protein